MSRIVIIAGMGGEVDGGDIETILPPPMECSTTEQMMRAMSIIHTRLPGMNAYAYEFNDLGQAVLVAAISTQRPEV